MQGPGYFHYDVSEYNVKNANNLLEMREEFLPLNSYFIQLLGCDK